MSGMLADDPDYRPYVPGSFVPPPKADCGVCTLYPPGPDLNGVERGETLGRDSECPVHGIAAHPQQWRTPDAYRVGQFSDALPEIPKMTAREADADERRDRWSR